MFDWFMLATMAMTIVALLSVLYSYVPAGPLPASRPRFAIFPKYQFKISNIGQFTANLLEEGFTQKQVGVFTRGSVFGDFSLTWAKLRVKIEPESDTAVLESPFMLIAFDTGDLFDLATRLNRGV